MTPRRLLLPALFLFVLGAGNIIVGSYKEWQYRQVYEELAVLEASPDASASGLDRLQNFKQLSDRYLQGQIEARERLQFYRLVAFGGKTFIGVSIGLLAMALLLQVTRDPFGDDSGRGTFGSGKGRRRGPLQPSLRSPWPQTN